MGLSPRRAAALLWRARASRGDGAGFDGVSPHRRLPRRYHVAASASRKATKHFWFSAGVPTEMRTHSGKR